jgi:hypothetical protein
MDDGTESGVASFLIPKTVQNGIRGCFISHPQNSSKRNQGLLHFSSPKDFIYKIILNRLVSPSVQTVIHVPVEDSATTVALASSGGTPGWGVIRNAAKMSVSLADVYEKIVWIYLWLVS